MTTYCEYEFNENMAKCDFIARQTWISLSLPEGYRKMPLTGHCFRVFLPPNKVVKAISCSISYDANRRILEGRDVYETILFGHNDREIYIDYLGYDNIKRLDTVEKMEEEIVSVYKNINGEDDGGARRRLLTRILRHLSPISLLKLMDTLESL